MPTQQQKIIKKAKEILENSPNGIRYMDLVRQIQEIYPDIKLKVIQWEVWSLPRKFPKTILKPERGIFILKKYYEEIVEGRIKERFKEAEKSLKEVERIIRKEENFYQSFADYLVNDLEECTKALPLGGNKFRDRWGTPDVIGAYRILGIGHIQPPIEIISAEIKTDINQLITSFGQACAYKLFSHKVYLVIPKDAREIDIKRLESLCLKFGIGLILFDRNNPKDPKFEILTRAIKEEPDYFYVNRYLRLLEDEIKELF